MLPGFKCQLTYFMTLGKLLGWPKSSFQFSCTISWKNPNELFGQLSTSSLYALVSSRFCCCCSVGKSEPTLCNTTDCSPPGSSVYGILQARILEWLVILFSKGSSQPRDRTQISCIAGRFFTVWATREAPFLSRCQSGGMFFQVIYLAFSLSVVLSLSTLLSLCAFKKKERNKNSLWLWTLLDKSFLQWQEPYLFMSFFNFLIFIFFCFHVFITYISWVVDTAQERVIDWNRSLFSFPSCLHESHLFLQASVITLLDCTLLEGEGLCPLWQLVFM